MAKGTKKSLHMVRVLLLFAVTVPISGQNAFVCLPIVGVKSGMLVWSIGLSLGGPTGYSINPARDLAPRIAHAILPIPGKGSSDWGYSWVPVFGPLVGAVIGGLLIAWYKL